MPVCPKCQRSKNVKNGHIWDKQRWLCKNCGCSFTRSQPRGRPPRDKAMAILMYCHGMSMTSIGFILGVTTKTVLVWVRDHARTLAWKQDVPATGTMELDEMWHYLGQEKTSFGSGKLFVVTQGGLPRGLWVDGMKERAKI